MRSTLKYVRKYFILFITLFSYLFLIKSFYIHEYWLMSTVYLMVFFIFVHYFFIELKEYGLKYFIYILLVSTILEMFIIGFDDLYKILSLYVINFGIIMLIVSIDGEINNRKYLSSWSIFNSGVGLFTLFLSLSYSFMFIGKYDKFDLTCDVLYDNTNKFIDIVSRPLKLSFDEATTVKKTIMSFYNTKVSDVVGYTGINLTGVNQKLTGSLSTGINNSCNESFSGSEVCSINKILTGGITGNQLSNSGNILTGFGGSGAVMSNSGNVINNISGFTTITSKDTNINKPQSKGIIGKIDSIKYNLLQIFDDKKNMDTGICSYMIEQIGEKYDKGTFKFSVVLLLFFLLWPFLRLMFFIISIINLLLFKILNLLRVYRFQLVREDVEELL